MDVTTLQQQLFITDLMHKNEKNHNENLIENEPSFKDTSIFKSTFHFIKSIEAI